MFVFVSMFKCSSPYYVLVRSINNKFVLDNCWKLYEEWMVLDGIRRDPNKNGHWKPPWPELSAESPLAWTVDQDQARSILSGKFQLKFQNMTTALRSMPTITTAKIKIGKFSSASLCWCIKFTISQVSSQLLASASIQLRKLLEKLQPTRTHSGKFARNLDGFQIYGTATQLHYTTHTRATFSTICIPTKVQDNCMHACM